LSSTRCIPAILILLGTFLQQGNSQFTVIDQPVINVYTPIEEIYCADDNDVDSLVVGSLAGFGEGDTVMVYCVKGADQNRAGRGQRKRGTAADADKSGEVRHRDHQ